MPTRASLFLSCIHCRQHSLFFFCRQIREPQSVDDQFVDKIRYFVDKNEHNAEIIDVHWLEKPKLQYHESQEV